MIEIKPIDPTATSPIPPRPPLAVLRRFMKRPAAVERCDLCSAPLTATHQHLLDPATRQVLCSCDACAILFGGQGLKYRRVPRSARRISDFRITDAQWDNLQIPISLAFFCFQTAAGRVVATYPSPAGAMESLLPLDTWRELVAGNPLLNRLEPDVEAMLVNRVDARREYYVTPIDDCYRLIGLIRGSWRGLSGGTLVWQELEQFFADLRQKSVATTSMPGEQVAP